MHTSLWKSLFAYSFMSHILFFAYFIVRKFAIIIGCSLLLKYNLKACKLWLVALHVILTCIHSMLIWTLFGGIIATSSVCHVDMIMRSGPLGNWASLGHERSTHPWINIGPPKHHPNLLKLCCLFVIIKPQKSACEETQGAHVAKGFKRTQ